MAPTSGFFLRRRPNDYKGDAYALLDQDEANRVFQDMLSNRTRWVKPMEIYELLLTFGGNIVASEGASAKLSRSGGST